MKKEIKTIKQATKIRNETSIIELNKCKLRDIPINSQTIIEIINKSNDEKAQIKTILASTTNKSNKE